MRGDIEINSSGLAAHLAMQSFTTDEHEWMLLVTIGPGAHYVRKGRHVLLVYEPLEPRTIDAEFKIEGTPIEKMRCVFARWFTPADASAFKREIKKIERQLEREA